jgi:hypothetical protein
VLREELVAELSRDPRTSPYSRLIYTGFALAIVTLSLSSHHSAFHGYYPWCGDSAGQEHTLDRESPGVGTTTTVIHSVI